MNDNAFEILGAIMQWIIAPVAAFVWFIYLRQQDHSTKIAVIQAETKTARETHDKEIREIKEATRDISKKLDRIEEVLRK